MPIVKYLWEEHGKGDLSKSRQALYTQFLQHLSQNQQTNSSRAASPHSEIYQIL